MFKFIAKNWI